MQSGGSSAAQGGGSQGSQPAGSIAQEAHAELELARPAAKSFRFPPWALHRTHAARKPQRAWFQLRMGLGTFLPRTLMPSSSARYSSTWRRVGEQAGGQECGKNMLACSLSGCPSISGFSGQRALRGQARMGERARGRTRPHARAAHLFGSHARQLWHLDVEVPPAGQREGSSETER